MNQLTFREWCDIFITEDERSGGSYDVQLQFPDFTVTMTASDLAFVQRILDFVVATKGNPEFRDIPLGDGSYRSMPEKSIDLSPSFGTTSFKLEKDGQYDDSYVVRVASPTGLSLIIDLRGKRLDAFIEGLRAARDEIGS